MRELPGGYHWVFTPQLDGRIFVAVHQGINSSPTVSRVADNPEDAPKVADQVHEIFLAGLSRVKRAEDIVAKMRAGEL